MSKIPNFSKIELDQSIGINNEEIEKLASTNSDQGQVEPSGPGHGESVAGGPREDVQA